MIDRILPAFSVIIPVYNGESVIGLCIESILKQAYQFYELIIIDDGSTDQTQNVCQNYYEVDSRIKYCKKNNGGVSSARNAGINIAQNEYIIFVDADDYLSTKFLQNFVELVVNRDLNNKTLVIQDFVAEIQFSHGRRESYNWCKFLPAEYTLPEMFQKLSSVNWLNWGVPFAKLYCLSIIKKHNILFNEQMSFREDLIFMLDYINCVDNVIFDSNVGYHYTIDNTKLSLSNTTASFENEKIFFSYMKRAAGIYNDKFHLDEKEYSVLNAVVYSSFFRCVNSCIYKYKKPISRRERIEKLKNISTEENINGLLKSGIIDNKIKYLAFIMLKNKLYKLYDSVNKLRYHIS